MEDTDDEETALLLAKRNKDDKDNAVTEKMSYVNTEIHRVVKGMYVQAGDLSKVYGK